MKTNPIFDERLKKVQAAINHENEHVLACYMGKLCPQPIPILRWLNI